MRRGGKIAIYIVVLLLILCICKRISMTQLAAAFLFPNLTETQGWRAKDLPITPKEDTILEMPETYQGETFPWSETFREQMGEENQLSFETLLEQEETSLAEVPEEVVEVAYTREQLEDYDFLTSRLYTVDGSTKVTPEQLLADRLLEYDFHVNKDTKGPQILIYHTHSQEAFADSVPGDESTTIVGMGSYLTKLLQQQGFLVLHHKEVFDMKNGEIDRNKAYTRAEPVISKILEENPDIQIVIDLHRDGVGDNVHLVKEIEGKPTAQIMFFNGMSYSAKNGAIEYLPNPYIENNLALTLQMKLASDQLEPGFARKIYLKSLRFNLHLHPGAMLIEAGAQTNTVEEMRNAMEVLARVLGDVLY